MRPVLLSLAAAIAVLLTLGGATGVASARPKVALAAIVGDERGELADDIAEALDGDELGLVYPRAVTRAIERLGLDESALTEKQIKKLSGNLEVDAVMLASLERDGKHRVLRVKLYIKGKRARGFKVTFNNARSRAFQTQLRDKVVARLDGDREPRERDARDRDDRDARDRDRDARDPDDGEPRDRDDRDRDRDARDRDRDARDPDDGEPRDRDDRDRDDRDPDDRDRDDRDPDDRDRDDRDRDRDRDRVPAGPRHAANRVAVRADLGVSVQGRSVTFTNRQNFAQGPKPYSNSPVPGARIEAEVYPFAFGDPTSPIAGLGIAGDYDHTLSLTLRTSAEPTVPVAASQSHWSVGLRFRIPFGRTALSPTLTLGAGVGRRSFTTDRTGLMDPRSLDLPDTAYALFDPGMTLRIPVARAFALTVGGRALLITDAGPIQTPDAYGQAKAFGVSAQAGLDVVIGNRFAIRLVGEFVQVGFDFTGNGELSNNRDLDPATQDVGGAADQAIGGAVTFGVLY